MKTVEKEAGSWDDLIFENANHAYGAYMVRKAYPYNVNRAVLVTLGLAVGITALSVVRSNDPVVTRYERPDLPTAPTDREITIIKERVDPPQTKRSRGELPPVPTAQPEEVAVQQASADWVSGSSTGTDMLDVDGVDVGPAVAEPEEVLAVAEPPKIYDRSEVMPAYQGGLEGMAKFISKNIKYPAVSRRNGVEGTVFVSFVIGRSGEVMDVKVVKGLDASCDAEAIRVISSMSQWSPGLQGGMPVMVRMMLPLRFRIQ
jgi:protein TonB